MNKVSKYEQMRTNPDNWTLGIVYHCGEDPRLVVRQLLPFGWTWNFGHPGVYPAILVAITVLLGPPTLAWCLGYRSIAVFGPIVMLSLALIVFAASRNARDPEECPVTRKRMPE